MTTRHAALRDELIERAVTEIVLNGGGYITVCRADGICREAKTGCAWCRMILVDKTGAVTRIEPTPIC